MSDAHPTDALLDLVDERLPAAEAEAVRVHLSNCPACREAVRDLQLARSAAGALKGEVALPPDLAAAVSRALDLEAQGATDRDGVAPPAGDALVRPRPAVRSRRGFLWVGAGSAAALLAYAAWPRPAVSDDLPSLAARDLAAVGSRSLPLGVESADPSVLARYFAGAPGPAVRVIDLAMMNITLEGGVRHTLAGRPGALYSYRLPTGSRLVCQMFVGQLTDLPVPDDVRDRNGFRFLIYARDRATLVFWQEGELLCVLAAELPPAEVIALAVAKAMASAP